MNLPADASPDQSNCPLDYYRRNNGMLHQKPVSSAPEATPPPLGAGEIAELLADDNKLRKLAKGKLVQIIHATPPTPALVAAINALLDRIDGKATQRIEQKVEHIGKGLPGDMTTADLMMMISQLPSLPAGIKLLPDGKLDVVDVEYAEVATTTNQ